MTTNSRKPIGWLHGEIKTPPFSGDARGEWRIIYRVDPDAILVVDVFQKKTRETPHLVIANCRRRLREYDVIAGS